MRCRPIASTVRSKSTREKPLCRNEPWSWKCRLKLPANCCDSSQAAWLQDGQEASLGFERRVRRLAIRSGAAALGLDPLTSTWARFLVRALRGGDSLDQRLRITPALLCARRQGLSRTNRSSPRSAKSCWAWGRRGSARSCAPTRTSSLLWRWP